MAAPSLATFSSTQLYSLRPEGMRKIDLAVMWDFANSVP